MMGDAQGWPETPGMAWHGREQGPPALCSLILRVTHNYTSFCSHPYHSTYTCLRLGFQLFLGIKCSLRPCAFGRNSRDRVIWGSENGDHTLNSVGGQERLHHTCTPLRPDQRQVYGSCPSDLHVHFWGRAQRTSNPTPPWEVDTWTTWLQRGQLGTSSFLASESFLPPVVLESMNKEGLGRCCEQRSSPSDVWTPLEPTVSTGVPWNNHHMENSFKVPTSSYCSHETPTAPKDLLTAHPGVPSQLPRNPVTAARWVGKSEGTSDSVFAKCPWNIKIWSLKTISTGPQRPSVFARWKLAVGAFHTNLCEAAINISNSTVNTGLPTAASMRHEPTNTNLEEEKKFVCSHDCFALGLLDPWIKQLN